MRIRTAALALAAALLVGCNKPPELMLQRLSEDAPALAGLPPAPLDGAPTPLADRPPFGLYATAPSRDTLEKLSTGTLSPDGRFRAIMGDQGVWVTRIDGAWLWQVPLLAPVGGQEQKAGQTGALPGTIPAPPPGTTPPPAPKATRYIGAIEWTPRGTLLLRDDLGVWVEANPVQAAVGPLPQSLQGKDNIQFSPDGKQMLYYTTGKTGRQLWVANADGTNARYLGDNMTGFWDATGKPVTQKATPASPGTNSPGLAPDLQAGPGHN